MKVCIITTAYNEAKHIKAVLQSLSELGFPTLVVDDGSTDQTAEFARNAGAEVITNSRNEGKGASLQKGFERGFQHGHDTFILLDSDGQHHSSDIPKFIEARKQGFLFVMGNRFHDPMEMPLVRLWTNRFLSKILSLMTRQPLPDGMSGFRLIDGQLLASLALRGKRFEYETEMVLAAAKAGVKIHFVPVQCLYGGEKSDIHVGRDTFRLVCLLVRMAWPRFFNRY